MKDRTPTIDYSFWAKEYGNDPAVGPQDGRFWDCECETDYIHLHDAHYCEECGAYAEDAPDSRVNEILNYIADGGKGISYEHRYNSIGSQNLKPINIEKWR